MKLFYYTNNTIILWLLKLYHYLKKISYRIIEDDFQPKIIVKNNTGREKMIYIPWGSGQSQSHIYFQNVFSNFWEVSDDERKHYNLFNIIQMIEYFV